MAVPKVLCIMTAFLLGRMFSEAAAEQCGSEYSIYGMMLKRHIFKTIKTSISFECLQACNEDFRCQSFNYVISQDLCELNNRTKEACPEDFVHNSDRYYYPRRHKTRVPLGSIQLPAESCREIKRSEGGQAVSTQYWFDSIIPGKVVLAPCDMNTEDMDECSASIPACDVNATCQNTIGSYICTCKTGLTGDGKSTCSDVDECVQGSHDCLPEHASCTNTEGSYSCACNHGYAGDGKTNCEPPIPEDCQNYQTLNNADRKITYALVGSAKCDRAIATGWYRFHGDAGTRMPTSCPSILKCQTHATGWLNGVHPAVADGNVTRQVCFHYSSNCCRWNMDIEVRNCGSYYIYYLRDTPACSLRFCGTD